MDNLDSINQSDSMVQENPDDEHLMMDHVIQDEHDLYYLHVCLSELLCNNKDKTEEDA